MDMPGNAVAVKVEGKYRDTGPIYLVTQQQPCFKLFITCLRVGLNIALT